MSASPFASIIIPTYNGGVLLDETLATCLKIKGVDVEILLIDDASTDGTPERVEQKFPTVKLHRLPVNSGSGAHGRNVGLAMARGEYVKFLDHDDLIQPRGFKEECRAAQRSKADIVMSRWGVVPINEQGLFRKRDLRLFTPPEPGRLLEAILRGESTPYTAAALYKRSLVCAEQWDANQTLIDDYDWFCRMAVKNNCRVTGVDTISYFWRLHSGSTQGRSHHQATIYQDLMFARFNVYTKLEQQLDSANRLSPDLKRLLAKRYYECLRCFARFDHRHCARLMQTIYRLDPAFVVDSTCEPEGKALWLIRQIGLANFLRLYGGLRRLGDATNRFRARSRRPRTKPMLDPNLPVDPLRPPGAQVPDRG
ncbi:MAG: glycosyltransferase family 2 protein [Cyanobacteriota bacterium]|nr:glycosyltransferase family 2 protein [Cyanobacteriota bacterium]